MDKTACTCGGENANCFRCFGTGMYSKKTSNSGTNWSLDYTGSPSRAKKRAAKKSVIAVQLSVRRTSPRVATPNGIVCGLCGIVAPTALVLEAHRRAVHGSPHQVRNFSPQGMSNEDRSTRNAEPVRDHLDATAGWGGAFRDYGQFGSPVAHDPMDDESNS